MTPNRAVILAVALLAAATNLDAQGTAEAGAAWSASLSLYQYFLPDEPDYAIAEGMADRGRLHLEGRWNYEDIHAGSLFAGWTLSFGRGLEVELTPMAGLVVGSVFGVAPGLELSASLGPFELYAESEYVVDLRSHDDSFFYTWSQLGVRPLAPLQLGLTAQRLRVYQSPLEVERGPFGELTLGRFTVSGHLLNPWTDSWFAIAALALAF